MNYTPVPDKEAATLLGVSQGTIRNAVKRGDLIRVPMAGQVQHVAKEQALLFQGKTQLVISSLNKEERKRWDAIEEQVSARQTPVPVPQTPVTSAHTQPVYLTDRAGLEYMNEHGVGVRVKTEGDTTVFQPAQADEVMQDALSAPLFLLLLGLVLLLFAFTQEKREAQKQAEETIEKIGLEKEDLRTNQREVIVALRQHPREARKLKSIIDGEKVLTVA